jgi:hypothetical protein
VQQAIVFSDFVPLRLKERIRLVVKKEFDPRQKSESNRAETKRVRIENPRSIFFGLSCLFRQRDRLSASSRRRRDRPCPLSGAGRQPI